MAEHFANVVARPFRLRVMPTTTTEAQNEHARRVLAAYIQRVGGQAKVAAKALGVSNSMLSEIQGGSRRVGMKVLRGLSREMGVTLDAILGGEDGQVDESASPADLAKRQFLGSFPIKDRALPAEYVREKEDGAARLSTQWSAYQILSRYYIAGYDAWLADRKGKAVAVDVTVDAMDEEEATPAFARKKGKK